MASVYLKNVNKAYPNGYEVVKNLNLVIEDRELVILAGPPGCGKSTILRMIAGLEQITEGQLQIGGATVNDVEAKDRDIAMVFQNFALYPNMSVYDNISLGLKLRNVPLEQINSMVEDVVQILELEEVIQKKAKKLKQQEKYRVALGRAIIRNPKVLLMDEPLLNLDGELHAEIRKLITKLNRNLGITIVYATQDIEEARSLGKRIIEIDRGVIQG